MKQQRLLKIIEKAKKQKVPIPININLDLIEKEIKEGKIGTESARILFFLENILK